MISELQAILNQLKENETPENFGESLYGHPVTMKLLMEKIETELKGEDTGVTILGMRIVKSRIMPPNIIGLRDQNGKFIGFIKLEE